MGEALYRKHRPKKLEDVVGQPHITTTLTNAIKSGRISHGYLFSGPRGVGKTSVARILAHQVNNFEYGDNHGSLDIIEIDAASNRRIDEIRDLRDKVHTAPVAGKYKVYIIDEVHMLTREAFNALLKTLEEPPAHVIFILATTEAHKLPETIVSRTQRYTFKAVPRADVIDHLRNLAKQENIIISDDALALIAEHGEGSFRDSISLLDQLSSNPKIKRDDVQKLLGLPPTELIDKIFSTITNEDLTSLVTALDEASIQGTSSNQIGLALVDKIRGDIHNQQSGKLIKLGRELLAVNSSSEPARYLELTLVEYVLQQEDTKISVSASQETPPKPLVPSQPKIDRPKKTDEKKAKPVDTKKTLLESPETTSPSGNLDTALTDGLWEKLLASLKNKYNTLYGVARMAHPSIEEGTLILGVPYAFHQKRLSEEKNAAIIRTSLMEIAGSPITIRVEIVSPKAKEQPETIKQSGSSDTLEAVTKIFGGGEVLET